MADHVTYTAPCPNCGRDCEWVVRRAPNLSHKELCHTEIRCTCEAA